MPWLNNLIGGEIARDQQKMVVFAREAMARRVEQEQELEKARESPSSSKDIFHYLFQGKDPETGAQFSKTELASESELLLLAGGDTTACVLSGCLFYLLHNPGALQRLCNEVRSAFTDVEQIRTGPALNSLVSGSYRNAPPPSPIAELRQC
jgi:cytochrome P450